MAVRGPLSRQTWLPSARSNALLLQDLGSGQCGYPARPYAEVDAAGDKIICLARRLIHAPLTCLTWSSSRLTSPRNSCGQAYIRASNASAALSGNPRPA